MKFKKGDKLISSEGRGIGNGLLYTFESYFPRPYKNCVDCLMRGNLFTNNFVSLYSTQFWFESGRHVLTEITREINYEV